MTLTVYSEMQYDVQNDCPCCGYSRKFWSLVTSTVCAASFTFAQWATVKSSSMTLAVSLASNQAATVEQHWAYFAGIWQIGPLVHWYPCLGCHSIPNPIYLGLECWVFWTETLIQMKAAMGNARFVCWNNACWVVEMNSRGLRPTVKINFLASLTEVDPQFLLCISSQTLQTLHVQWVECEADWVLDLSEKKCSLHSVLSCCQFQTSPMLHHIMWMNGRREVLGSSEVPAVERCDESNCHIHVHCPEEGLSVALLSSMAHV